MGFLAKMVDALAAIGFAANILQFVDYICHVLKVGRQLRRQGMVESNQDLEQTARLLEHQVARIRSQQGVETGLDESDQVSMHARNSLCHYMTTTFICIDADHGSRPRHSTYSQRNAFQLARS